jgi:hypothetical protein
MRGRRRRPELCPATGAARAGGRSCVRRRELRASTAGERGVAARAARASGRSCVGRRPELRGAAVKTRVEERSGGNIWGRGTLGRKYLGERIAMDDDRRQ